MKAFKGLIISVIFSAAVFLAVLLAVYVSKANAASDELAGLQKWFEQACIPGVGETARSYWYVVDDTGEWGLACEKTLARK